MGARVPIIFGALVVARIAAAQPGPPPAAGSPQIVPQPDIPAPPPPPPPPAAVQSGGIKTSDAAMLMGGGAAVGAGIVLLWAAHTHSGDADAAATVKDHDRISGRSTGEYILGGVAIAGGVALGMWALHRIRSSKEADTAVAFMPGRGGGTLVLEHSW